MSHKSRLSTVVIDCQTHLDHAARFWSAALGRVSQSLSDPDDANYRDFADAPGKIKVDDANVRVASGLIICPSSVGTRPLSALLAGPGAGKPAAIDIPAKNRAAIRVVLVNASALRGCRALRNRKRGRVLTQEAFAAQLRCRAARVGTP